MIFTIYDLSFNVVFLYNFRYFRNEFVHWKEIRFIRLCDIQFEQNIFRITCFFANNNYQRDPDSVINEKKRTVFKLFE